MEKALAIISSIAAGLFLGSLLKRKNQEPVWDPLTAQRIAQLHPVIRAKVADFILEAQKRGIYLRVFSGLRTFDQQARLYAQGRTAPGTIVTNAKPGESWHNYGLAFDVVEMEGGRALWSNPRWKQIGALGKNFGFEWGGDWKSFDDKPHFEYSPFSIAEARRRYNGNYIRL